MKKKNIAISVIVILVIIICGVCFYQNKVTVPNKWIDKTLSTSQVQSDNHLSNVFDLNFTKNHAYLVSKVSGNKGYQKTNLSNQILKAYGKDKKNFPQAGDKINLGRVKSNKIDDGYKISTHKVTFIFKKISNGAYRSQDGTIWQFAPKNN